MKTFRCSNCNSTNLEQEDKGFYQAVYCFDCKEYSRVDEILIEENDNCVECGDDNVNIVASPLQTYVNCLNCGNKVYRAIYKDEVYNYSDGEFVPVSQDELDEQEDEQRQKEFERITYLLNSDYKLFCMIANEYRNSWGFAYVEES